MSGIIDHLVYATDDLERSVASLTDLLGVEPTPGGQHLGRGTRNELVSLGGTTYLEIVGPDRDQRHHEGPMPFDIHELVGERLVAWCARPTADLDHVVRVLAASDADPGPVSDMWRARPDGELLSWRLTFPRLDHWMGPVPFLIDWLESEHPTVSLHQPVVLRSLHLHAPESNHLSRTIAIIGEDIRISVETGESALVATLGTPNGEVVLRS
jgi:catechol 2,3-dioxygenase-like lactoylglutathione lyase family enzyme